jgi:NADH pyrophosphatase NudC (nudix superfamily)
MRRFICPKCKNIDLGSLADIRKVEFCSQCGAKMVKLEDLKCKCGNTFDSYHKFCSGCGLSREDVMKQYWRCSNCATLIDIDTRNCTNCGCYLLP